MALGTPPTRIARPGASVGRGRPRVVTMRRTTALEPALEGVAFADEVMTAAERLQTLGASSTRAAVVDEAGRLGHRAEQYRAEFRRLAQELDR